MRSPSHAWRRSARTSVIPTSRGADRRRTAVPRTFACRGRRWSSNTRRRAASITFTRSIATRPTITEQSLRASSAGLIPFALIAIVLASIVVSAHRRDEFLQAARIAIDGDHVDVELDQTPGIAVADAMIADLDRDRDGALSADEQRAYVNDVVERLDLLLDGRGERMHATTATFPALEAICAGEGAIQLRMPALVPAVAGGTHQLTFRNRYHPNGSAYLANALVPRSDRIAIATQQRDSDQRELTIAYTVRGQSAPALPMWQFGAVASAIGVGALLIRPRFSPT